MTDEATLDAGDVLEVLEPGETYLTTEIADELPIGRRQVLRHLDRLETRGEVEKEKPEPRRARWRLNGGEQT